MTGVKSLSAISRPCSSRPLKPAGRWTLGLRKENLDRILRAIQVQVIVAGIGKTYESLGLAPDDFYWHFVRPIWPVFALILFFDLLTALSEVLLATFLAQLIDLMKGTAVAADLHGSFFPPVPPLAPGPACGGGERGLHSSSDFPTQRLSIRCPSIGAMSARTSCRAQSCA